MEMCPEHRGVQKARKVSYPIQENAMSRDDNLRQPIYCAGYYTGEYSLFKLCITYFIIFYPIYYFPVLYFNAKRWIIPKMSANIT